MRLLVAGVAGLVLVGGSSVLDPSRSAASPTATSCVPFVLVDSRGSGEPHGLSRPGAVFARDFREWVHPATVVTIANPYRASGGWIRLAGAFARAPIGYHSSVVEGKTWLDERLAILSRCGTSTRVVVVGYSQGAQVAADVYQAVSHPNLFGAVLFGDPYFNASDGASNRNDFSRSNNGSLGQRPRFTRGRVLSHCHRYDPVCQKVILNAANWSRHGDYHLDGASDAAREMAGFMRPAPRILRVFGASGVVRTTHVWLTVTFRDPQCDVAGVRWDGATGSGLIHEAAPVDLRCSNGIGSLRFARSCLWTGTWTEYLTLTDARGNRGARFSFVYTCR